MAGRIRAEDVALVKERTSIEDVVREHVTLRPAGVGSLKGLCPFHDEKSPSFHVRPMLGVWHCFGCNEGGDAISFVQKVEHLTFHEAVERLAVKSGVELRYEDGGGRPREDVGRRTRLIEAHRMAEQFYAEQLATGPDADRRQAVPGRPRLRPGRGHPVRRRLCPPGRRGALAATCAAAASPTTSWSSAACRPAAAAGSTTGSAAGWSGRSATSPATRSGFGARRLYDDDRIEAKYLNTAESPIYSKATVLYGLDLAKKAIARDRQAVVVEGYTDVMACHLAGVDTAIATCGTAFGSDHITILRRIMRDEAEVTPAEVIFTFDGDAAGQKAAMRAFAEDQRFVSQTYVAVEAQRQGPVRAAPGQGRRRGPGPDRRAGAAVRVRGPHDDRPVRPRLRARPDAGPARGRPGRRRHPRPGLAAGVRPPPGRPARACRSRPCSRPWRPPAASPPRRPTHAVRRSSRPAPSGELRGRAGRVADGRADRAGRPARRCRRPTCATPTSPASASCCRSPCRPPTGWTLPSSTRSGPRRSARRPTGSPTRRSARPGAWPRPRTVRPEAWVEQVASAASEQARPVVTELAVAPLLVRSEDGLGRLAISLQVEIAGRDLLRQEAEVHSRMQRLDAAGDAIGFRAALVEAEAIVRRRTALRERLG